MQFMAVHQWVFPIVTKSSSIPGAKVIFTDGSSNGQAAYVCEGETVSFSRKESSAQLVELTAVLMVFKSFSLLPFNLYIDSAYVAFSIPLLETISYIKPSSSATLLLLQIQQYIRSRRARFS